MRLRRKRLRDGATIRERVRQLLLNYGPQTDRDIVERLQERSKQSVQPAITLGIKAGAFCVQDHVTCSYTGRFVRRIALVEPATVEAA